MQISVVGTGYVGLVTSCCLASRGHNVTCVDIDSAIVAQINRGRSPIFESRLDDLLQAAVSCGKLRATTNTHEAVSQSDITLICVGTPTLSSGVDLTQLLSAAQGVGEALVDKSSYHIIAVKSTVLPGTTEGLVKTTIENRSRKELGNGWGLCMTPEFLREGQAVNDFLSPDRIVIGASDERAGQFLLELFANFDCPKIITTLATAEMIKYVSNSLLATVISFSNEIANVCSKLPGINARDVWTGVHSDRRLTPLTPEPRRPSGIVEYLWHGLGFGGSCFPKDVAAFRQFGEQLAASTPILDAVAATNNRQPLRIVALLEEEMDLKGKRIALLGLAFKPGTDDLRESPALPIIKSLLQSGACVVAHDPAAVSRAQSHPGMAGVTFAHDWSSALKDADACCLVTAWPEYQTIAPSDFKRLLRRPLVIDGRGMYDPTELSRIGVVWRGIGYTPKRDSVKQASSLP